MAGQGGLAEECVANAATLIALPDAMSMAAAAGFLVNYGTTYHALVQRANLKAGETLLVLGAAGGVGLTAIEIGKALGARVLAAASTRRETRTGQAARRRCGVQLHYRLHQGQGDGVHR